MAKKPRISKNAFDWIKDTSEEEKTTEAKKQPPTKSKKQVKSSQSTMDDVRKIWVKYGEIVDNVGVIKAIEEITKGNFVDTIKGPYLDLIEGELFAEELDFPSDIVNVQNQNILFVHLNYKVNTEPSPSVLEPI